MSAYSFKRQKKETRVQPKEAHKPVKSEPRPKVRIPKMDPALMRLVYHQKLSLQYFAPYGLWMDNNGFFYQAIMYNGVMCIQTNSPLLFQNPLQQRRFIIDYCLSLFQAGINYLTYLHKIPSLSEEEIEAYQETVENEIEEKQIGKEKEERLQPAENSKNKQLVLQNHNKQARGFVDALLLSLITMLFGSLCLAYIFMGISI